jgi:hypothetical protein
MKALRLRLVLGCGLVLAPVASAQEAALPEPAVPPSQASLPSWSNMKLDDLTITRERPLFTPDRRPEAPSEQPAVADVKQTPPKPRPNFALKGIIAEGPAMFVLLENLSSSESFVVRSGETIGAWRVVVETERSVTVVGEGERISLQLFDGDTENSE